MGGWEVVINFFPRKGDKHEKGGDVKMGVCHFFDYFTFQSHLWCVCGKSKVFFNTSFNDMVPQSFELAMPNSHPSLY